MGSIFISYAREDHERVATIVSVLEGAGMDVWWDGDIPPGENYREIIDEKLCSAPAVCVIWSQTSIHSNWVAEEAEEGVRRDNLIPIMLDDVEIPRGFRSFQALRLCGEDDPGSIEEETRRLVERVSEMIARGERPGETVDAVAPVPAVQEAAVAPVVPARIEPHAHHQHHGGHGHHGHHHHHHHLDDPLALAQARQRNSLVMLIGTVLFGVFAFHEALIAPDRAAATQFRLLVGVPILLSLTGLSYVLRARWQVMAIGLSYTWTYTLLTCVIAGLMPGESFGPEGYGLAFNVMALIAVAGTCLAFNTHMRAIALAGTVFLFMAFTLLVLKPPLPLLVNPLSVLVVTAAFVWWGMDRGESRRPAP